MLELRALLYFVKIAEAGSLTKAAIGLDISHSVLSRQVQDLENSLGYRVFYRTGRGVELTEAGKELLPGVQELLVHSVKVADEARALGGAPSGAVTVGLPGSIATVLAGPLYRMAQEKYPKIRIRLVEALSGVIDELLVLGRIDIGLFFNDRGKPRKGQTPLCIVELVLVAPRGDKLTSGGRVRLRQLSGCPLILPSFPHALRRVIEDLYSAYSMRVMVPFEVDSLSTMIEVVAAGRGYTVAPYSAVVHDVTGGRVQIARITNPAIKRLLVMVLSSKGPITTASRATANLISTLVEQAVARGDWTAIHT